MQLAGVRYASLQLRLRNFFVGSKFMKLLDTHRYNNTVSEAQWIQAWTNLAKRQAVFEFTCLSYDNFAETFIIKNVESAGSICVGS